MSKTLLALFLLPALALAEAPIVVPDGDPLASLLALIAQWKTGGALAIASAAIVVVVQSLKQFLPDFKHLRLAVTALGVVYGILLSVLQGMGVLEAAVSALLVSGGAVAIYEALKPAIQRVAFFGVSAPGKKKRV